MIKDFKGKVAVITGAAQGIGRSLSQAFVKRGMKVVLADINKEALDTTAQKLKETSEEVLVKVTDVSNKNQVAELAEFSYKHFENVNILCNNAGVCHAAPIRLLSLENWNWVFNVNFYGMVYGIHNFMNRMLESNTPCHIINTSSSFGLESSTLAPYGITKHAIIALSETLSAELNNTNVGVSVLCPGWVRTNLLENTENLGKKNSGILELTPEVLKLLNLDRETLENAFKTGMDPDIIAEKVIKAIKEDIFYILPSPETMDLVRARFNKIQQDSIKLNQE